MTAGQQGTDNRHWQLPFIPKSTYTDINFFLVALKRSVLQWLPHHHN